MTVSTEISSNEYTGNGVTTDFDYKFRIFKENQLSVITSDADGDNVVTLRLGTDYTVTGANKSAGGKVILTKPLANGHKISIARDIPIKQETSFRNQGKFFAETHEDAFDYLTMIIQRIWGSLGSLYLKRPNILANWFDAKGYRIANLGKPKRDSDAVDLGTLNDEIEGVSSTILKKENRTLRVDDEDIPVFPKASERKNKQIGFDNLGMPALLDPIETGSLGYQFIDSFEKGALLTGRFQALFWEEERLYFRWDGNFLKHVPAGSTPHSTGGIKTEDNPDGLWVNVADNSLRIDIKSNSGASMIGSSTGENIEVRLNAAENSADLARKGRNPKFVKIKHIISFEEQGYQSIVNQHAYTFFGQQGMFVDTIDSKLYLSYQTTGGEGDYLNKTWVIVFDWKTGKRLLRLCTDTRSAPEGISVIHDGNNRILLLPNHENYTTRKYIINDSTQDMSYLLRSKSFPTGARYQFGHYGDKIAFNRDVSQGTGIDDDNANRVDIYPVSQFISGSELKKISSLSIDSMISGRGGMKPKRQGLTLGDNCIITSCGGDTSTTASKSDGMYGFMKFNFDGSLAVDGLFDPVDLRNEMMRAGYPEIRTTENEGCCVTNENGIAEIYTCSLSVLRGGNYQNRVCIIIQHNCEYDDETLDLSNITSSFNQFYNDFPTRIHTLTADNPRSNGQFQNAGEVCEYMRSLGVSTYTLTTQSNFNVDVDAVIVVPSKTTITIESIDHNVFRVRWSLTSGWQGDIRLYKSELYKLTESSYNSLRNESLPVFSGSQSIGVVNCPTWSPVGTGNGVLFESGYNQNRIGQLFVSSTGERYSRFVTFESRNTTTGWVKY